MRWPCAPKTWPQCEIRDSLLLTGHIQTLWGWNLLQHKQINAGCLSPEHSYFVTCFDISILKNMMYEYCRQISLFVLQYTLSWIPQVHIEKISKTFFSFWLSFCFFCWHTSLRNERLEKSTKKWNDGLIVVNALTLPSWKMSAAHSKPVLKMACVLASNLTTRSLWQKMEPVFIQTSLQIITTAGGHWLGEKAEAGRKGMDRETIFMHIYTPEQEILLSQSSKILYSHNMNISRLHPAVLLSI